MTRRALIAAVFALFIAEADLVFAQGPDAFSYFEAVLPRAVPIASAAALNAGARPVSATAEEGSAG